MASLQMLTSNYKNCHFMTFSGYNVTLPGDCGQLTKTIAGF